MEPPAANGTEIVVWNAATGRRLEAVGPLASIPPGEDGLELDRIAFLSDSELAAVSPTFRPDTTGAAATALDVWRLGPTPGSPILDAGLEDTQFVAFSPDGGAVATLSGDALNIWSGALTSVTTGTHLVVHAYVTRAADAARRVCTIAGRDLTAAEWQQYLPGVQPVRLCGASS